MPEIETEEPSPCLVFVVDTWGEYCLATTQGTTTHELGHALGFVGHAPQSSAVMFDGIHSNYELMAEEIEHLRQFYTRFR